MLSRDLAHLVAPSCDQHNAHLLEVVVRGRHARPVIEIFVDAQEGVTSDLCSTISRDVGKVLSSLEGFPEDYTVVVSSPGIERPLRFLWQYRKHIGRKLIVKMEGHEERGTLRDVGTGAIILESDGEMREIAFDVIREAIVQAPW